MIKIFAVMLITLTPWTVLVTPTQSETTETSVTTTSTSTTSTTLYIPECEYENRYNASYNSDYGWYFTNDSCTGGAFTSKVYEEIYAQELMEQGIVFEGYYELEPDYFDDWEGPQPLDTCNHPDLFWLTHIQGIDHITAYDDGYSGQIQYTLILCEGVTYDVTGWDTEMGEWNLIDWATRNELEIVVVDS